VKPQSTIPEAVNFDKGKDFIEGMRDDFWKRKDNLDTDRVYRLMTAARLAQVWNGTVYLYLS